MGRGRPRQRTGVVAGLTGTILLHGSILALVIGTAAARPQLPPVYAVELVAAPAPAPDEKPRPQAVERPPVPEDKPAPVTPPKPAPTPPKPEPKREPPPTEQREPTPKTSARTAPAPGETPGTGSDAVTIKTPGLTFAYPEYLRNIVEQVYRRWERPSANSPLRAEVSFLILRDGSVRDIRFLTSSRNFSFDLAAQGAIEAAGAAHAFGPLPDGYEADVLPVSFYFTPRAGQ